jgi:4-amino-4-deoxy-L-arabinose transferase-like glycosyltransferase
MSLWHKILLGATIVSLLAAHLATLTVYPQPTCDEATYASSADSLLRDGRFGLTVYTQGDPFGRDQNMVHIGRIQIISEALLFWLFGTKWEIARVYALLGLGLSVWLTYELGRRLYSTSVGMAAALMLAASVKAFLTGHQARPDSWTTAAILLGLLGLWNLLSKPAHWPRAILAGLLGVMAFDFHGNALWFLGGGSLVVCIECLVLRREWIKVLGYGLGLGLGIGLWLATHLWPDPALAWYQLTVGYRLLGNSPAAHGVLYNIALTAIWLQDSFGLLYGPLGLMDLGLLVIGLGWATQQRNAANRFVAVILVVSLIGFTVGMSQKFPQYALIWLPLTYLIAVASLSAWLSSRTFKLGGVKYSGIQVCIVIVAGFVALNSAGGLWLGYRFRNSQADRLNKEVRAVVPPGARVLAGQVWWWALNEERTFISDEYVSLPFIYPGKPNSQSTQQLIETTIDDLKPDYLIIGNALACSTFPDEIGQAYQSYARQHCQATTTLRSPWVDDTGKWFTYLGHDNSIYRCD